MLTGPRLILILTLMIVLTSGLAAQTTSTTTTAKTETTVTATTDTAAGAEASAEEASADGDGDETRNQLNAILYRNPSELATILVLEPNLLSNEVFLSGHPELAKFVAKHPEVKQSPRFYLSDFSRRANRSSFLDEFINGLGIFSIFFFIALALAWFVRAIIEQKRWSRLARTQSEAHNKILDRFSSNEDLLAYVKSPAGTKFLESAPIPVHQEPPQSAPLGRAMWSIQIGVIVAAGALGLLLVSGRFDKETAEGMFALGAIGVSVGVGFIASAVLSLVLSKRLGLWKPPVAVADEPGLVR